MPLGTPTEVASAIDAGVVLSVTTGAFTPVTGSILFAFEGTTETLATPTFTDSFAGALGAWSTPIALAATTGGSGQLAMSWSKVGDNPGSHDVTVTTSTAQRHSLSIISVAGVDTFGPVVQSHTTSNQSSTLTNTLPATPSPKNLLIGALVSRDITPTIDADFTRFVDRNTGGSSRNLSIGRWSPPTDGVCAWTNLTALFVNVGLLIEVGATQYPQASVS